MTVPIFYIKEGNLSFAQHNILSSLELYIMPGDRICLVGRNGCGKSSLMKVIDREYELDSGELFQGSNTTIGYLRQDMKLFSQGNIYDFVLSEEDKNSDTNKYQADIILKQLSIDGNDQLKNCSGGQVRRVCLARVLLNSPDILLLDEPTNHLDIIAIEWLESYIKNYNGAVVCISHDRTFQENISNKVWWLDRGILRKSSRGFKHYDDWRDEIIEAEESVLRKMNRKLEVEKGWLQGGVTGRRKRNQKRLANLHDLRESYKTHQSHLKNAKAKLQIELEQEMQKTKFIIEAENISYSFPDKKLFDDFTFKVKKGEKIGVIGPNGIGKSTFIKILIKELEPHSGKVKHGTNLDVTYFDQYRSELNPDLSLKQTLCPNGGDQIMLKNNIMHIASYLKKFMFDPKSLENKVSTLSGGEANRLLLAKALINPGNFFILDEPTNDLDMDSLEMLLDVLADYTGTLIVVSHDRDFLERLVTRTLVFTGDEIIDLYGGYTDYLKYYKKDSIVEKKLKKKVPENIKEASVKPTKLSYKYVRRIESLPSEIEQLEQKIIEVESKLSQGDLYNSNIDSFNKLSALLDKSKLELDEKLEEWLELEIMKDNLNE